jgi:tetrahydromethanopterin S-methyltransferase subunit B
MEPVRATWTDERLDDLNHRVDELGRRMDSQFARVDTRFDRVDARFDAMQRTMIQFGGGMIVALLGLIVTVALQH